MKHRQRTRLFYVLYLLVSVILGIFILFLYNLGVFEKIELSTIDYRFRFYEEEKSTQHKNDIIIVSIDDDAISLLREFGKTPTESRDVYGYLVDKASANGAQVIAFDLLFKGFDQKNFADLYFRSMLQKYSEKIVFAIFPTIGTNDQLRLPEDEFVSVASNSDLGVIKLSPDFDGIIRGNELFYLREDQGNWYKYPMFAPAIYKKIKNINDIDELDSHFFDNFKLYKGKLLINYSGTRNTFEYISLADIIRDATNKKKFDYSIFENKIILVGPTAATSQDFHETPFNRIKVDSGGNIRGEASSVSTPGVEIHANFLNTLLNKNNLVRFSYNNYLFMVIIIVISIIFVPFYKRILYPSSILSIFVVLLYIVMIKTFQYNVILEIIPIYFLIFIVYLSSITFKFIFESLEKSRIHSIFGKYLDKEVVNQLVNSGNSIEVGGEEREVTILFSDIANFTTISETVSPKDLVLYLNDYFNRMIKIIGINKGILDKFIGDAVMAIFNAPINHKDHADSTLLTAIEMKKSIDELRIEWKKSLGVEFDVRIGINSGFATVGNIGADERMNYTVIGDNVNLAARLEGANKIFGTNIMISESTFNSLINPEKFILRELDLITVKGKHKPVKVFEVIGLTDDNKDEYYEFLNIYSSALQAYRNKDFETATAIFSKIQNDSVAKLYIKRCKDFIKSPPPENWDGVYKLTTK